MKNQKTQIKLTKKQYKALEYLEDKKHTEILYGGAAGGGKSFLGCLWIIQRALKYPGTRYMIGRARLKDLKESTLLTFFELCKTLGLKAGTHFEYNANSSLIKFFNKSEIYLKDLFQYPRDPEFEELGSREYTAVFIDEASEIVRKAKDIVISRIRYRTDKYDLIPKIFIASNPTKNFLYSDFYKPHKKGELPEHRAFIPALPTENKHLPDSYIDNLKRLDKTTQERLLFGNWEYEDDPSKLFEIDALNDMFELHPMGEKKYLSVDVARLGKDKSVICYWQGSYLKKIYSYDTNKIDELAKEIKRISKKNQVPSRYIIIDEGGIGGGVIDMLSRVKGFISNAKPVKNENYGSLKAQCYFRLAKYIDQGKIGVNKNIKYKDKLIEDLEQIRQKNPYDDGKIRLEKKSDIKERLGRSPDYADAMMMRMYYELKKPVSPKVSGARIFR